MDLTQEALILVVLIGLICCGYQAGKRGTIIIVISTVLIILGTVIVIAILNTLFWKLPWY